MKNASRPLTAQVLEEEVRFLLKTLMRDDLFGESVALTEAEKLLETSLTVPFVEYCALLPRLGVISVDRGRNVIQVTVRGRDLAKGAAEPDFFASLIAHFAGRIESPKRSTTTSMRAPTSTRVVARPDPTVIGEDHGFSRPPVTVILDGRYVRHKAIGEGSVGTVFAASDEMLGRLVVEKVLNHVFSFVTYVPRAELSKRLRAAIVSQARLDHPSILPIHEIDFDVEPPRVVMAKAMGGSLVARMAQAKSSSRNLDTAVALRIFVQAAHALAHAHAHHITHGGLKPANVLFDVRGNVMLSDFSLASATEKPKDSSVPVYVGAGAPSYMAPEQLHHGEISPAADVYALGIILYELLTGSLPGRRSPMPSDVVKNLPAGVDDVFDVMTRDAKDERPKDGAALLALLATALKDFAADAGVLELLEVDPCPLKTDAPKEVTSVSSVSSSAGPESLDADALVTGEGDAFDA